MLTNGRRMSGVATAVVGVLGVLAASTAGAGTEADDEAFQRWATQLSQAAHKTICAWGGLAHAASRSPGRYVWFTDKARPHASWLVFESGGRRWLYRDEERVDWGGTELKCEPGGGLAWTMADRLGLTFTEQSNVPETDETVTFLDGALVELAESERGYHDADDTSWIEGTQNSIDPHPLDDSPEATFQHMLFALPEGSRWWAKVPAAPIDVTFGAKRWTGKPDADFNVRVVVVPQGLRVELAATDDRAVPPAADADPRAIVRADHFELWFCAEGEHSSECEDKPAQLAVARTAAGGALSRWLRPHPRGAPAPAATIEKDHLVVVLPRALLGAEPTGDVQPALVPLTIAYSDSDDPAAGQQTMVATARIKRAKPDPPSLLALPYDDRPFPRWTRAQPLAKDSAIFAEDPTCGEHAVARAHAQAAAPLKSGAYADAAARLKALVDGTRDKCSGQIAPDAYSNMRIDLALARHKLGDDKGCVAALGDTAETVSPPVARTRQFHRALCGEPCKDEVPGCLEGKAARAGKK